MTNNRRSLVPLEPGAELWERCFTVAPLIVVGTRDAAGRDDLAPKHLATPLSWEDHFGFVCTPDHTTYHNVRDRGCFTVSFPPPEQIVQASLAAGPRCSDGSKPSLAALTTCSATEVDAPLLEGSSLQLECELDRIVDGFAKNSLIAGRIVAARAAEEALREADGDDADVLQRAPLLAYLHPGRFARIDRSLSFPFHTGFSR